MPLQKETLREAELTARETHRDVLTGSAWLLLPMSVLPLFIHHLLGDSAGWFSATIGFQLMCAMVGFWFVGSLLLSSTQFLGRAMVTIAMLGTLVLSGNPLVAKPVLLLAIVVSVILVLSRLWLFNDLHFLSAHYARSSMTWRLGRDSRLAAIGAVCIAGVNWFQNAPNEHLIHWAAFASAGVAYLALVIALIRSARYYSWRSLLVLLATAIMLVALNVGGLDARSAVLLALMPSIVGVFILPRGISESGEQIDWWEPLLREPSRLFAATFLGLAIVVSFFLALPISAPPGARLSLIDSIFMAVSAVCITGLATVEPLYGLSKVGRTILLLAVQLGGLGVMTFSFAAMHVLRRRMSIRMETAVSGMFVDRDRATMRQALKIVFAYTFGLEALGALIFIPYFRVQGATWPTAIGEGIFTAISAFNNAGFTLTGASVEPFVSQPIPLMTVAILIIAGGLSPFLVLAAFEWRRTRRMPVAHQLPLIATIFLLIVGTIGFLAIEWQHTMIGLGWGDKVMNAFFQSTSARTAGLTSFDLSGAHPATVVMLMLLMTIGGSPGGVGGGIKTTTAAILLLAVVAAIRGRSNVQFGNRYLPHATVYRAAATASVMAAAIFGASMLMMLTQSLSARQSIFEVVSALTTTGHSLGATVNLDAVGKSIIIVCMFMGRVGMLTLFMFLSSRELVGTWQLAKEDIDLG